MQMTHFRVGTTNERFANDFTCRLTDQNSHVSIRTVASCCDYPVPGVGLKCNRFQPRPAFAFAFCPGDCKSGLWIGTHHPNTRSDFPSFAYNNAWLHGVVMVG